MTEITALACVKCRSILRFVSTSFANAVAFFFLSISTISRVDASFDNVRQRRLNISSTLNDARLQQTYYSSYMLRAITRDENSENEGDRYGTN